MVDFEKKNLFDIYFRMTLEEVVDYYQQLRKYQLENNDLVKGLEIRKRLYAIIKFFMFIDSISNKRKVTVLNDDRYTIFDYKTKEFKEYSEKDYPLKNRAKTFVATHIGRYDCESVVSILGETADVLMSDAGVTYKDLDGLVLRMMGVTWFDHDISLDRHYANLKQTEVLLRNGNVLLFPERGYCIDPINPVGKIHPGFAKRSIATQSAIVPISLEQYQEGNIKNYIVNVGNSITTTNMDVEQYQELAEYINDYMIELKKDIWNVYGGAKPTLEEFLNDPFALENYKEKMDFMMRDVPDYYTLQVIARELYQPSEIAIESLKQLKYIK